MAADKKAAELAKKRAGRYPSGNEGKTHPGLKHTGYAWKGCNVTR